MAVREALTQADSQGWQETADNGDYTQGCLAEILLSEMRKGEQRD